MESRRWKTNKTILNEPLFRAPLGSPERDPGLHIRRGQEPQYLPPHRYDSDEEVRNIYRTSDEAYAIVARALAYEYACCKHTYDAYVIVKRNLTPTQRKFFADAHMERAMNVPFSVDKGEATMKSLVRQVDLVFGMVFLEYYASKDGILIPSQVESINRVLKTQSVASAYPTAEVHTNSSTNSNIVMDIIEENTVVDIIEEDNSIVMDIIEEDNSIVMDVIEEDNSIVMDIIEEDRDEFVERRDEQNPNIPIVDHRSDFQVDEPRQADSPSETSFDRLYYDATTKEEATINGAGSANMAASSDTTEAQTTHSKLRQELLREIMHTTQLARAESDENQRKVYEEHLVTLRRKFNKYIEKGTAVAGKDTVKVLQSQDRVHTNEDIKVFEEMPTEHFVVLDRKMVFEFEQGVGRSSGSSEQAPVLRFIRIVAPMSLEEGYTFEAKYRNLKFLAKVPEGGVRKGQSFVTPMLNTSGASRQLVSFESVLEGMQVPKGAWRDGLFNCVKDPLVLLSFGCPHGKWWRLLEGALT